MTVIVGCPQLRWRQRTRAIRHQRYTASMWQKHAARCLGSSLTVGSGLEERLDADGFAGEGRSRPLWCLEVGSSLLSRTGGGGIFERRRTGLIGKGESVETGEGEQARTVCGPGQDAEAVIDR